MQKHLYLIRHAKTEKAAIGEQDRERTLTQVGIDDALECGAEMLQRSILPDAVYCSTAVRTQQTLSFVQQAMETTLPVVYEDALYNADSAILLNTIHEWPDTDTVVMVIAHNPTLHQLAADLSASDVSSPHYSELCRQFPPMAVAHITFDCSWNAIREKSGTLQELWLPSRKREAA